TGFAVVLGSGGPAPPAGGHRPGTTAAAVPILPCLPVSAAGGGRFSLFRRVGPPAPPPPPPPRAGGGGGPRPARAAREPVGGGAGPAPSPDPLRTSRGVRSRHDHVILSASPLVEEVPRLERPSSPMGAEGSLVSGAA